MGESVGLEPERGRSRRPLVSGPVALSVQGGCLPVGGGQGATRTPGHRTPTAAPPSRTSAAQRDLLRGTGPSNKRENSLTSDMVLQGWLRFWRFHGCCFYCYQTPSAPHPLGGRPNRPALDAFPRAPEEVDRLSTAYFRANGHPSRPPH